MSTTAALLPRWTKRVSIEDGGRDPLGLSRVSAMITDYLLHGIITQTYRARYYSFYCWIIWHIDETERATSYRDFANSFQRRDTFFTLASLEKGADSHLAGVRTAKEQLAVARNIRNVKCDFRVLPSSGLGAFGQYYEGSILNLGLISRDVDGIYHVTDSGKALALAFHETIGDTPYIRKKQYLEATIPWNDFAKSCTSFHLDGLAGSRKERELLTELFFRESLAHTASQLRAYSLSAFLQLIDTYAQSSGGGVEGSQWQLIYAPCYYGQLVLPKDRTKKFVFPDELQDCAEYWKMFCAHQFFTVALEHLLTAVLDLASENISGIPLDEICQSLTSREFLRELSDIHGASCRRPKDLLERAGVSSPSPDLETHLRNQRDFRLDSGMCEWLVLDREPKSPPRRTAVGLSVLAMLYAKWAAMNAGVPAIIREKAGGELTMWSVFPYVGDWFSDKATWTAVLQPIIEEFVLNQHDRVMYGKGKLESCWLQTVNGRVTKDQDYSPDYRSSRCENSMSILKDLGAIERKAGKLSLTKRGVTVLGKVLA
jgi:hypothetical protein